MGSGKAKKARQKVFKQGKEPSSLPTGQRVYIEKEITKLINNFERERLGKNIIPTPRAFPCQKVKGQFAYIQDGETPIQKEDGLWYIKDELIVSDFYKGKIYLEEMKKKIREEEHQRKIQEQNVKELKPQVLGE